MFTFVSSSSSSSFAFTMQDELGEYEDDYYIIDCPGQIELCDPGPQA
jgi:hypothetical protein